ncbi:tandem-95 repeat protein, partial [Candidatus Poribacteria bacterium]|nr:tandem-95 repeat protein [Candidatus Poribacteria bacterium]
STNAILVDWVAEVTDGEVFEEDITSPQLIRFNVGDNAVVPGFPEDLILDLPNAFQPRTIYSEGGVDLDFEFRPNVDNDNITAYLITYIRSEREREVDLYVGSDDSIAVWLNGELVHVNPIERAADPDQDLIESVFLRRGRNILMLKVAESSGSWGAFARFDDASGLTFSAHPGLAGAPLPDALPEDRLEASIQFGVLGSRLPDAALSFLPDDAQAKLSVGDDFQGFYHAGLEAARQPSFHISEFAPSQWTVVTRDLYEDWGPIIVDGLAFLSVDGLPAAFDYVGFGKGDVPEPPAIALPPTMEFNPGSRITVDEDGTQTVVVTARDPNPEDTVTLRLQNIKGNTSSSGLKLGVGTPEPLPPWIRIEDVRPGNPARGVLSIAPGFEDAGRYNFTVEAVDNSRDRLSTSAVLFITVDDVNRDPTFIPLGAQTVSEGNTLRFTVIGQDADGEDVTLGTAGLLPGSATFDPGTGRFTWAPTFADSGVHTATFTADDPRGGSARMTVQISVSEENRPPTFDAAMSQEFQALVGKEFLLAVQVSDADQDLVDVTLVDVPAGVTFDSASRSILWTPTAAQEGAHALVLSADDGRGGVTEGSVSITVSRNRPVWQPVSVTEVRETQEATFRAVPVHPDDLAMTLSFASDPPLPTGVVLDEGDSMFFRWVPGFEDAGSYLLTFTARDPLGLTADLRITLDVENFNRDPSVADVPAQTATVSQPFVLSLTQYVDDPDADDLPRLSFSKGDNAPPGVVISSTGQLEWSPSAAIAGEQIIPFIVSDPSFSSASGRVVVFVEAPPAFAFTPSAQPSVDEGGVAIVEVSAMDGNTRDTVTLEWVNASAVPNWVAWSVSPGNPARATITLTPGFTDAGLNSERTVPLPIRAVDSSGQALTAQATLAVVVVNINRPPVLAAVPQQTLSEGEAWSFTLSATDEDADDTLIYTLTGSPPGMTFDPGAATIRWTPSFDQAATHTVTATVRDRDPAGVASREIRLVVLDVNRQPVMQNISAPSNLIEGSPIVFTVRAVDPDADNTLSYRVNPSPAGVNLGQGTGAFRWTPQVGQAGEHNLTFTVDDGEGGTDTAQVTLDIEELDNEPPSGSIALEGGTEVDGVLLVDSPTVTLELEADDNRSAQADIEMQIRNAGGTFSDAEPVADTKEWEVSPSDGEKTVQVRFEDEFGNRSEEFGVAFTLDTTAPQITHTRVTSAEVGESIEIAANVTDETSTTARLFYRPGGEDGFTRVSMPGDGSIEATIPSSSADEGVAYYIEVEDALGHTATFPAAGAENPIGVAVSGDVTQTTTFPPDAWHIFSVPLASAPGQLTDLLDAALAAGDWSASTWNGQSTVATTPTVKAGQAFWLTTKTPLRLDIQGAMADPAKPPTITVRQGWNLVGNPYVYPVPFGNVKAVVNGHPLALDEGGTAVLRQRFWRWSDTSSNDITDGDYKLETALSATWEPWEGYWVLADAPGTLVVEPFGRLVSASPSAGRATTPSWDATLALNGATGVSRVSIALAESSMAGYDALDIEQPPTPSDVRLSLVQDGAPYQRLSLPSAQHEWVWDAQTAAGADATLTLASPLPPRYRLYVEDAATGLRTLLTGRDALRIEVGERALRLRLTRDRLGADVLGFAPTRTQLLANYPNPFNPETWIPFTLAAAGDVVVNVYDVNGRRVRSIALGRLQAGRYSDRDRAAYWDGRNDTGESAASGAYIYELRTEDAREMRRMVIRK